jgi:hypothetical protein
MAISNIHSFWLENNHIAHEGDCFSMQFDVDDVGAASTSIRMVDSESNVYGCPGGDVVAGKVNTICNDIKWCLGGAAYVPNMDIDEISIDVSDASGGFLGNYNAYSGMTPFTYMGTSSVSYVPEMSAGDAMIAFLLLVGILLTTLSFFFRK